ncbi:MAG: PAS domain S-box protein, partial [Bacteroidota bacterium]
MAGLKINICFWYLDPMVVDDVLLILKEGKFDVDSYHCKDRAALRDLLTNDPPDLFISDFDLADNLRKVIEKEMRPYFSDIPFIYLVGEKNERKAEEALKLGVWDTVLKGQLHKLVPSVYSSQKYSKVIKQRKDAERALKESRDRYMSIFESVNQGIILFDFETREVSNYNPRFLEMFGVNDEDMKVLNLQDYSPEDEGYTIDRAREYIAEAEKGKTVSFEWRNIDKKGKRFWTSNSFSIVKIDDRPYILLVTQDVDEQKKMEQSLLQSQEHFRALAENSPDVIMRFDRDLRHIYVNLAAEIATGIKVEDFLNKSHLEMGVFPEEKVVIWEEALKTVFSGGKPHTIIFELEADNQSTVFEWRLYPEADSSKAIESVVAVARNITDSRDSQDALTQSEERLNLALHATNMGLWDWNLVTNEVYFSSIWFSMLGYGPDELPHEYETWTNLQHPDDVEHSVKVVQDAIRNREDSFEIEFRLRTKQGSYLWICGKGKAVERDEDGNTIRLTGIHENIDERKREELVKQVLFDISNAVSITQSLDELYDRIREYLGRVLDTTNCFLALYNEEADTLTLPFMEDEKDSFTEFPARKTLTSYVIKTGEAQLVDKNREKELTKKGEIEPVGAPCESWLGVPLKHEDKTIGVFAVQSYTKDVVYTKSDASLLEFASDQIAMAIDRRRHQDNIRISQEKQRRVFESSPDPMIVTDPNAMILDFNSAFLEVFNVDPSLVHGEKVFRFINRMQWRQAIKDFNETWSAGYLKNLEYQIVRPDGVTFDGEVSSGAIYDGNGKPESMVIILKNITERKEAERKMLEAKYKAEESDKLKT